MNRREFLAAGCLSGIAALAGARSAAGFGARSVAALRFAPHPGQFRSHAGDGLFEQIRFAAEQGFAGWDDRRFGERPSAIRRDVARALADHGLAPGPFVATADFRAAAFASGRRDLGARALDEVRRAIDVAAAAARSLLVMPGRADAGTPRLVQLARAAVLLHEAASLAEPAGVSLLLEPVDSAASRRRWLVESFEEAAALARVVDHPRCRVVCDVYALAVEGGRLRTTADVLQALDRSWEWIGHVQLGDAPGRKEPGSGTLDFAALFTRFEACGYRSLLSMDHGSSLPGLAGERRVLQAYRRT